MDTRWLAHTHFKKWSEYSLASLIADEVVPSPKEQANSQTPAGWHLQPSDENELSSLDREYIQKVTLESPPKG